MSSAKFFSKVLSIVILAVVMMASFWLNGWKELLPARFFIYQHIFSFGGPSRAEHVAVVKITDREHYTKDCSGEVVPVADYLAKLIVAIADDQAAVIAVDILPVVAGKDSANRMKTLVDTIKQINETNKTTTIVVPEVLSERQQDGHVDFVRTPFGFDELHNDPFRRVKFGYVRFSADLRQIPWAVKVKGIKDPVNSFAVAIAAAKDPNARVLQEHFTDSPYARFWKEDDIPTVEARDLLEPDSDTQERVRKALAHRVVIIGGEWHEDGCGVGEMDDLMTSTPRGPLQGVYIHASYVESILSEVWFYRALQERDLRIGEVVVVIALAAASAYVRRRRRFAHRPLLSIAVAGTVIVFGLLVVSEFLSLWGIYFDIFIPCLAVWIHGIIEDYREAKESVQECIGDRPV